MAMGIFGIIVNLPKEDVATNDIALKRSNILWAAINVLFVEVKKVHNLILIKNSIQAYGPGYYY